MDRFALGKRRHKRLAVLMVSTTLAAATAQAQVPYPTTAAPPAPWGGYAMPAAVPYQPTLVDDGSWQPYPDATQVVPAAALVPPGDVAYPDELPAGGKKSLAPPGARNGVFQKIKFTGTYLPRFDNADALGMSDLQLDVVFGVPFFTRESPLVITPYYAAHFVDGPAAPDVPPRLHDAAVLFQHYRRFGDQWLGVFDLTIGAFADDESFDASDALRITGGGAAVYESSPCMKWVLGATYIDRANADVLPIAGFIYTPTDDVEYKLVFPAPKISWRLPWTDVPGQDERWAYIGAEYGGGVWAVERTSGATDELDITEYRVFLGLERKIIGGLSRRVEVGYVFGRELQYDSTPGEVALDDTLMLRAGLTY